MGNTTFNSYSYKYFLVDILSWLIILPIIGPITICFYIYKTYIHLIVSFLRKDLSPISSYDFMVARESLAKKPIVDIGFILKIQGRISLEEIQRKFTGLFLNGEECYKHLYCTLEVFCGYIFFKRVQTIRIEEHITEDSLDCKSIITPQDYFSLWFYGAYKNDKAPRWEMRLLQDESKGESYLAFRMHHGLIDGFGMLLIVDKLCGQESPYLVPSEPEMPFKRKFFILLGLPREFINYWIQAINSSWPLSSINDVDKSDRMLISWTTLEVDKLKSIRRKLNVSFSSLLYVLQTGALRRHLISTGRENEITESLPVFHTIPKPNHPRMEFTNHWSFVKFHTPFLDPNAVSRVLKTERLYNEFIKAQHHIAAMHLIRFANLIYLPNVLSIYKAALSSMVRSSNQYKLFGKNVSNIYHMFCTKDLCPFTVLYTTTASHNKQIDITFAGARGLVGNQEEMNQIAEIHFKNEFQDLFNQC